MYGGGGGEGEEVYVCMCVEEGEEGGDVCVTYSDRVRLLTTWPDTILTVAQFHPLVYRVLA